MNDKNHGVLYNNANQDYFNKCILHLITDSHNYSSKNDAQSNFIEETEIGDFHQAVSSDVTFASQNGEAPLNLEPIQLKNEKTIASASQMVLKLEDFDVQRDIISKTMHSVGKLDSFEQTDTTEVNFLFSFLCCLI